VIDDEPEVHTLISALCARMTIATLQALTAAEAVAILRQPPLPDLCILDLMLPDVNGLDFLRQMRARTLFDALPVIVVSAVVDPEKIKHALALGADRYIIKTALATNLPSTMKDLLREGRRMPGQGQG
jgi:DNA-binding response OmpR family regulator